MRNFIFNNSAKEQNIFDETNEEFITIREIELVSDGSIMGDVIFVEERMKNGSTRKHPLLLNSFPFINENKVSLNNDIDNCKNTFLVPNKPSDKQFKIYYETLNDFFENTEKEIQSKKSSHEIEKNNWIKNVDILFELIQNDWLQGIPASSIAKKITRTEESIGTYEIAQLIITLKNGKEVKFTPLATYIIGGYGRIDIELPIGSWGSAMLILNKNEKENYYWTIVEKSGKNVYEKSISSDFTKGKFIKIIKDAFSI